MRTAAKRRSSTEAVLADDPLYVIFEQHLYNFQDSDEDRKTFICKIIHDYLTQLRRMNIAVPRSLEQPIVEELYVQVNTMLVKKMYGCLTVSEYRKKAPAQARKKARSRYQKLAKSPAKAAKPAKPSTDAA